MVIVGGLAFVFGRNWWVQQRQNRQAEAENKKIVAELASVRDPLGGETCLLDTKDPCRSPRILIENGAVVVKPSMAVTDVRSSVFPTMLALSFSNASGWLYYYQYSLQDGRFPDYWVRLAQQTASSAPTTKVNPAVAYALVDLIFDRAFRQGINILVPDAISDAGLEPGLLVSTWGGAQDRFRLAKADPKSEGDTVVRYLAGLDMADESKSLIWQTQTRLPRELSSLLWQRDGELAQHYAQLMQARPQIFAQERSFAIAVAPGEIALADFLRLVSKPGPDRPDMMICYKQQPLACRLDLDAGTARCQAVAVLDPLCGGLLPSGE